ncbi:MAG: 30S ribosomal protein S20 [Bacilli bacterium]|nr:30S ribosomal protein S20 [Bacilli bacterium]
MPNIKSAKKRVQVIAKKKVANNDYRASMRTAIKNVEKATDKDSALKNLNIAVQRIDKALSKGLVHRNYAARQKSRLTKLVNNME